MSTAFLLLTCLLALSAAVWAHASIRSHAVSTRLITHTSLTTVGLAFGWVVAFVYTESSGLQQALVFLSSFGVVHIPAAFILKLKQIRHKDRN